MNFVMPSTTYTHRLLYSAAVVIVLSCLVLVGNSWEAALHAPWIFPIFLFERSEVVAFFIGTPLAASACTLAVLSLAALRTASTVIVTLYFALSIGVTIDLLARWDGHS